MRKIISLAVVLMLVLCLATTAFAAEPTFIEDPTVPTDVVLEAGESVEYQVRAAGMTMTITNAADLTVTIDGNPCTADGTGTITTVITVMGHPMFAPPTSIVITNETDAQISSVMSFSYPEGSMENPKTAVLGANTADVPEAGYYFTYTAENDGVLIVTVDGDNWTAVINNETAWVYGDTVYGSDGVGYAACGMAAGDVLQIVLGTEDWTAATITFTASVVDHITEKVDPAEAECHTTGNIEHYYCQYCNGYFADEEATSALTEQEVFCYPALGSTNITHNEEVPAECHNDGVIEHWICNDCGKYFEDEACTIETNEWSLSIGATGATDVTHVEAAEAGCHTMGNIEHWVCNGCGGLFEDEWCWFEIMEELVYLPATGAPSVSHVEAVEPGCHSLGNIEHYICGDCGGLFEDEACTIEILPATRVTLPATGPVDVEFVEAVEPGCHSLGNIAHYVCGDCGGLFEDEACTIEILPATRVTLPATGCTGAEFVEAVEPGCHSLGNIAHWVCNDCGGLFEDEACTIEILPATRVTLPATGCTGAEFIEAVEPGCHSLGNIAHWVCNDCGGLFEDEACTIEILPANRVILPATGPVDVEFVEAVEPGCHSLGNIAHYVCGDCGGLFEDEACTIEILPANRVILPATGSENVVHNEKVEPFCHHNGMQEHWFCEDCGGYFTDAECTQQVMQPRYLIIPAEVTLDYTEAVDPTCHGQGIKEHWYCPECECYFLDAEGKRNTNAKDVLIPAVGSENVEHFEAVEAGCHNLGNVEYWYCADCNGYYLDEACTQLTNSMNVILPATGPVDVEHIEAVEPGCHSLGNIEHWICGECGGLFEDEACTIEILPANRVILPATGTENVTHVEAVEPGCHRHGMQEHWICNDCGGYFTDAECTQQVMQPTFLMIPAEGVLEYHEKVDATCDENGMNEYWYCAECDCYFTDAEGIFNIARKSLVIEATGHNYVDGKCEHCGGNAPSDNPDTGDVSLLMPIVGLLVSACGTVALVTKKKEY